jgi:hypothetical protein
MRGLGHQRPANRQHLLLAAAQGAGQLLAALRQHREQFMNPAQGLGDLGLIRTGKSAQIKIFPHREGAEDAATFRGLGDAHFHQLMRRHFVNRAGFKADFALRGSQQPTDGV